MKNIFVVIDPGHYGKVYNQGINKKYYESDRMYKLSCYMKEAFKNLNINCMLTRDDKSNPPLLDRGGLAIYKSKGYDEVVFISNHSNAFDNSNASGVLGFRSAFLPKSIDLLSNILEAVSCTMNQQTKVSYNRGINTRKSDYGYDWLGVLQGATNRAVSVKQAESNPVHYAYLIEYGFHTNALECQYLMNDDNLKKLANAVAKTIADYFGVVQEMYRVRKSWKDVKSQIGAFTILDNAKKLVEKNKGYHIYNSKGDLIE